MKGYWLVIGEAIRDEAAQKAYGALWAPIAAKYGARLIANGGAAELKEARQTRRVLIVEFPDLAAARACYDDPAYIAARELAWKASSRELLIFEGAIPDTAQAG